MSTRNVETMQGGLGAHCGQCRGVVTIFAKMVREDLYIGSTNKVHLLQLVRILHQMHLVTCMYATLYSGERRPRTE